MFAAWAVMPSTAFSSMRVPNWPFESVVSYRRSPFKGSIWDGFSSGSFTSSPLLLPAKMVSSGCDGGLEYSIPASCTMTETLFVVPIPSSAAETLPFPFTAPTSAVTCWVSYWSSVSDRGDICRGPAREVGWRSLGASDGFHELAEERSTSQACLIVAVVVGGVAVITGNSVLHVFGICTGHRQAFLGLGVSTGRCHNSQLMWRCIADPALQSRAHVLVHISKVS